MKNVLGLMILAIGSAGIGFGVGKSFSVNPTIISYRPPVIIEQAPGDVMCPEHHTCTWQVLDITSKTVLQTNAQR